MRVVIDTNVLVSALLQPAGAPARVLDLILDGSLIPIFDDRILAEYRAVLLRPRFGFQRQDIEALLSYFQATGEIVIAHPLAVHLPDPGDLPFLEVAAAAHVQVLITGNLKHFPQEKTGAVDVQILPPSPFLEWWQSHTC